jgi:hypothetical protein
MNKKWFLISIVVVLALLSSCSVDSQSTPVNRETETTEPAPLPTMTIPITQASTPSLLNTPTSLPAISQETAKEDLTRFIQINGGCELPCLLGLTPGSSGQAETSTFESYFQTFEYPLDVPENGLGVKLRKRNDGAGIRFQFWKEDTSADVSFGYYIENDVVSQIVFTSWANQYIEHGAKSLYDDPNYKNILEYFSLTNILNVYGPPSDVLIAPFPDDPGHPSPPAQYSFSTTLVYAQKGFLIQYLSIRDQDDKYFIGCPANSHIDIATWVPGSNLDLKSAVSYFSGVDSINSSNTSYFQELENVTDFDVNSFYETFKSSNTHSCIQTAKGLWPSP